MKSLRILSTLGVLAICTVFASAQDSGLGRGHGGGSKDKDTGSKSRSDTPPPSNSGRSSSSQDSGRSRDRSSEPSRSGPSQDSRQRDRSSEPTRGGPTQDSGRRDRPTEPTRSGPSQDSRQRDRSSDPVRSNPPQDPSRTRDRDRTSDPIKGSQPQDGGLGRGSSRDSSQSGGPTRDRGPRDSGQGSNSQGPSRDRGSRDSGQSSSGNTGSTRDRSPSRDSSTIGGGRDQGLGRGGNSIPSQARNDNQVSRSGSVTYRGSNNIDGRTSVKTLNAPPTYGIIKSPSMESRARREDASRSLFNNGWRTGYCHYNNNWNDSYFWYPNYCFSPFGNVNIVISPWYSYTFLPGYLNCNHVYVSNYRGYWGWNSGVVYVYDNYNSGYNNYNRNRELDYTIDDLQDGFEKRDFRALERLVPDRGQIAIYRDGRYDYSIDSRDFDDLLNDLSSNADTNRYRILETRINRDSARISALHEYTDQWGNRQRVYHSIYLEMERGNYVIREFGTSNSRVW